MRKIKSGTSLVEAVAVMAIVVLAVSVFTPKVLESRQKVRQVECANNLKRIGNAWHSHEQAQNFFPSSGWGWRWVGDPDRGFGESQPGGWIYDTVRFTEYANVANLGGGLPLTELADQQKAQGMIRANGTPIPFMNCPERRAARAIPISRNSILGFNLTECQAGNGCSAAKTDYMANSGSILLRETPGPNGNRSTSSGGRPFQTGWNGVTFQLSELRLAQITDGLSKTFCVGEKYLNAETYLTGGDGTDDNSFYVGLDRDTNGYAERNAFTGPQRDRPGLSLTFIFGSAHRDGFNVVNCDGSVRHLSYGIDSEVFGLMAGRNDATNN